MVLNNLKGDTVSDFNPQFPSQVYDHRLCMGELWHNFEILPKNCALYQGNVIFEFLVICPFVLSMFLILHTPSVTAVWTVLNSHVISIPCVYQWLHMKCISHISPIFLLMFVILFHTSMDAFQRKVICKIAILMMAQKELELATFFRYLLTYP